ncbi:cytochrome P450 [Kibdelosporangium aridum]|uniref:Cytochrome P450 n=1 Tax=Kibdelosporangium aridum TaxID=2030 RepID=A0A1W2AV20_KIBAR|nr:cytochrome P450 [Kibdelosporangium aridum]SMC64390.1 Cytochrome P450 [Kibdelosporangium aridum]
MTTALEQLDLTDPHTFVRNDLTGTWRRLRAEQPVYLHPETSRGPAFWVVSRYADVQAAARDVKRYTSERGNSLDTLLAGSDPAGGKMLTTTDPPWHTHLRKLLLRSFAPRALQIIVERVRATTEQLVADAVRQGECDVAADVAAHVPLATICDLLDIPGPDRAELLRLTKSAVSSDSPDATSTDAWMAKNDILYYFAELAEERKDNPHADIVSLLAASEVDGRYLSQSEVVLNCYNLILGGDETTRLAMVGAIDAFLEFPDQWDALADVEPATAVEEILRWTTPAQHYGRVATEDVVIAGQQIPAGDIVTLWSCSANRDETVFDRPDEFDLSRTPNNHLTFGYGPHFCIGAYLARVEIQALLDSLRRQVSRIERCGPSERIYSTLFAGISRLPVRLRAR